VESNEEKRKDYRESIKDISVDKLVYIDESVIEKRIVKDRDWSREESKAVSKEKQQIL
jgi:hypothetical protein